MSNVENTIQNLKEKLPNVTPTPPGFHPHANSHELKSRLIFGEPALTILDVRDRAAFEARRIIGATSLPLANLQQGEQPSVSINRDIYVYAETAEETITATNLIRGFGFTRVAELTGGLKEWESIGGVVEGISTRDDKLGADAFNVFSRLKKFSEEQRKEEMLKTK